VLPIERLADNPQLEARGWWTPYAIGGRTVSGPGAPYRFSATPWRRRDPERLDAARILEDLGWERPGALAATAAPATEPTPSAGAHAQNRRPLEGIRILDFTHVLAGPYATRVLADMGADVVKVNSQERALAGNGPEAPYYVMWNRNKRALALDMRNPEGRALARRLCETADIVIENFAVGVLDRWGIGYAEVRDTHPGVIYVQMSGMGHGGPWSNFVTYAPTIHALTGLTHLTSVPGREDIGIGFSYNDHQAGLHGAFAILAALEARRRTGAGQQIDLSQFEVGVNFLGPSLLDWFANGRAARPSGNRLPYDAAAPHGVYPCRPQGAGITGERWIAIACMSDAQWNALRDLLGDPPWAQDPQLATAAGRVAAADRLDERLAEWTGTQDAAELMARCQAAGVPAGVVQDGVDLAERDPQLRHLGFMQPIDEPGAPIGQTHADRLPLHFEKTPCDEYHRVRLLGEDNAEVLRDWLGMPEDEVRRGEADGRLR
jgi:crotonobetainyl-CoA:carnitine CoA-transferase CaiB-like acyl-CoA transferase